MKTDGLCKGKIQKSTEVFREHWLVVELFLRCVLISACQETVPHDSTLYHSTAWQHPLTEPTVDVTFLKEKKSFCAEQIQTFSCRHSLNDII